MDSIIVRPITRNSDFQAVETIQLTVWGMSEREVIPSHLLHALSHHGAALLGAFDGDKLVGFVLGVIGTVEGMDERIDQVAAARLQMYSTIMGVLPEYQGNRVGFQLKMGQRDFALRVGIRLITWTYDPLESRNAWFNVGKLGIICHQYLRDYHGQMGGLNAGLPTDRFHVDWWITSNRVKSRVGSQRRPLSLDAFIGGGAVLVNESTLDDNDLPVPPADFIRSNSRMLLVEIPGDFRNIKQKNMSLAQRWREHSRELFEYYFENNYVVTDFVRHREPTGQQRSFYLLTHGRPEAWHGNGVTA